MKRSTLGLIVAGLALFLAAPAGAQLVKIGEGGAVEVNAGGTKVKTGKGGTKVNAGGTKVNTGNGGTRVDTGDTQVDTDDDGAAVDVGGAKVRTGLGMPSVRVPRRGGDAQVGTFVCDGDTTKVLKGVVISAADGPAILAKDNCTLTIKGATLQGQNAVVAQDNATVKISGSTLQGNEHAVLATGSADVTLRGSTVSGKLTTQDSADIHKKGNIIR
ncbi:MAG: hypothetical protein KC613_06555 [Myxococcales bacterium]|nr:hypothetical protein [Myxococcales bacterium]MCB9525403.1 hypothetical protein [Myxococcales bacterium]